MSTITSIDAAKLQENLGAYLSSAINLHNVININTDDGNAILLSEEEYNSLLETMYLNSIPGMRERLEAGKTATLDDCVEFEW